VARKKNPTCKEIAKAQARLIESIDLEPGREHEMCWACGLTFWDAKGCSPEKAHVVADAHGGSNKPDNFFLLCSTCHREQPDGASYSVQVSWLVSKENWMGRTFKDLKPVMEAIRNLGGDDKTLSKFVEWIHEDQERFHRLLASGSTPARASYQSSRANMLWSVLNAFTSWKAISGH
jgi:hypothetical protein